MWKKNFQHLFKTSKNHKVLTIAILFIIFFSTVSLITLASSEEKELPEQAQANKKRVAPSPTEESPTPTSNPPTITSTPSSTTIKAEYPAQILDLSYWKIQLPTGESEKPDEVEQPELKTFKVDPWFIVHEGNSVRFRAPVNGVTTSGSNYPRSELREMSSNGEERAAWSSTSGKHIMNIEQSITAVPANKRHVVAGQIHDSDDDVIVIRLEYPTLYVNVDGDNVVTLDSNYSLGEKFKVRFEVENGITKVFYNDSAEPAHSLDKNYSGAYFKAGAYTQSNCLREVDPFKCNADNFGEVLIYKLDVSHQ